MTNATMTPEVFVSARYSPWFCTQIKQNQLDDWLLARQFESITHELIANEFEQLSQLNAHSDAVGACAQTLRQLRQRIMLWVMERDLSAMADLQEVVGAMTALADIAITQAYNVAQSQQTDSAPFMVVGMGKLGGGELNVSSDIDLIFISDATDTNVLDAQTRAAKQMVRILNDATPEFVFRVDLRLRPHGDAGPVITTLNSLESYFFSQAHAWERYAWGKARIITATHLEPQLQQLIQPFVYRRYLDFDSIAQLRELKQRIGQELTRKHAPKTQASAQADISAMANVKLGHGGIREIEFVAQLNQLIRGGREPRLQVLSTRKVLKLQAKLGLLARSKVTHLLEAYDFLRRVEHRLQYVHDLQTHLIPSDHQALQLLARSLGFETSTQFEQTLKIHRDNVHAVFSNTFNLLNTAQQATADQTQLIPAESHHADDEIQTPDAQVNESNVELNDLINQWLEQPRRQALSAATRTRLELILHRALMCLEQRRTTNALTTEESHESVLDHVQRPALLRLLRLLEVIAQRSSYITLMVEYPLVIERALELLGASEWAAQYLIQHPILLDGLVTSEQRLPINHAHYAQQLAHAWTQAQNPGMANGVDVELYLNLIREAHHEAVFACLLRDLSNEISIEHLADELSQLADTTLDQVLRCVWQSLGVSHATVNTPVPVAVIAYGKLGGKELGYLSDLDLVFLYDENQTLSDHETDHLIKVGQRLVSWLSVQTSSGRLYEIDTRLRPNGNAGLLVASFASFEMYQTEQAWLWEHQAITRARWCAGNHVLAQRFELLRSRILSMPRQPEQLKPEVAAMRIKIADGHPNKTELFDVKHSRGGMVDIEFIVQTLVLLHASQHPDLLKNSGNISLLNTAAQVNLISQQLAQTVAHAYRAYRKEQHALRLQGQSYSRVPQHRFDAERQAVLTLYDMVVGPQSESNIGAHHAANRK